MENLQIDSYVKRLGGDYTRGRKGKVIELKKADRPSDDRARVHWIREANGQKMNLRTWVRSNELALLTAEELATIEKETQDDEDRKAGASFDEMVQTHKVALVDDTDEMVSAYEGHIRDQEERLNESLDAREEEQYFNEMGGDERFDRLRYIHD